MRYILVEYPDSKKYKGVEGCYPVENAAVFVPELTYCKTEGTLYPFFKTVKNEELQELLSQHPKDADVAVEFCDVKSLKYFPKDNFIAID